MATQKRQHLTFRLPEPTLERLDARAHQIRETRTGLAERYLEEGLRMDEHPGIAFVDGPWAGARSLTGTGLDIWEVIGVVQDNRGSPTATARYLEIPRVGSGTRSATTPRSPMRSTTFSTRNAAAAEREEAAARRERAMRR